MHILRKGVSILFLLPFILIGCSSDSNSILVGEGNAYTDDDVHFDRSLGKFVPPVDLITVGAINPDMKFKNGEDLENNVHTRWAEERLGIRIRYNWTIPDFNGTYANKLRIELAKGNMPDIVTTRERDVIQELIDSGQFMEVGQLFDQYASPVWKKAMQEDPSVWDLYQRDGKSYAIPILDFGYATDPLLWIRQDWLDKLKLPIPRTIGELSKVMEAFANEDPDGNGKKDTYGLTIAFRTTPSTWMGDSSWIFGAFGTVPRQWNKAENGGLAYGSVQPEAKEALRVMKEWVQKGYIPKESERFNETQAADLFVSGRAGIIAGPYWMFGWPLPALTAQNPKAVMTPIRLPSGPSGQIGRRGTLPINGAILINKKMKHPEIFFSYQNYLFDHYATSTGEFEHGFAKDYDWTTVNGVPTTDAALIPGGFIRVATYTLTFDGARIPSKVIKEIPVEIASVLLSQADASRKEQFTGPPTPTMMTKWELLLKLEQVTFQQILFHDGSDGDFDAFVSKWNQFGGRQITKEANDWLSGK